MRASILAWSAFSGALLGVFADVLLAGIWAVATTLIPAWHERPASRWLQVIAVVLLLSLPVVGALLGFLEGRLKA